MKFTPEIVLLVEPDGANPNGKLRSFRITLPVNGFIERCHLDPHDPEKIWTRTWIHTNGERDDTRRFRVFREVLPPAPKEAAEKPLYDEMVVKNLKLGVDGATFAKMAKKYGKK